MKTMTDMQNNIAAQLRGMARVDIERVQMIAAGKDWKGLAQDELARRRVQVRVQFIQSLPDEELIAIEQGRVDPAELARVVCGEF